ncbi:MAG: hypothetical protein AAB408_00055 [Patescibacteria group bacterium]
MVIWMLENIEWEDIREPLEWLIPVVGWIMMIAAAFASAATLAAWTYVYLIIPAFSCWSLTNSCAWVTRADMQGEWLKWVAASAGALGVSSLALRSAYRSEWERAISQYLCQRAVAVGLTFLLARHEFPEEPKRRNF